MGISLFDRQDVYVLVRDYSLVVPSQEEGIVLYNKSEQARADLASRIRIITPDPYFNTLGGALAVAADGSGMVKSGCMVLLAGVCLSVAGVLLIPVMP